MRNDDNTWLGPVMDWILDVDVDAARGAVEGLRRKFPADNNRALVERVFATARYKGTASGVVTGLPSTLFLSAPAAATDAAVMLRLEVNAAAKAALVYDPRFFDDEASVYELLVPILGMSVMSQVLRELGVRFGMGVARQVILAVLSRGTLAAFKRVMLKYFGLSLTRRAVLTKALPIVGGLIGGAWNWAEMTAVRDRCITYFEGGELSS